MKTVVTSLPRGPKGELETISDLSKISRLIDVFEGHSETSEGHVALGVPRESK